METGYLTIDTYPNGSKIYIDDTLVFDENGEPGLTPARLTLIVGYHQVKLELNGYCDEHDGQYIMKDENINVFHNFNIC